MKDGKNDRPTVLVVDDDPGVLNAIRRLLTRGGYDLLFAGGPLQAVEILRNQKVAVVISDQLMPGMSGVELLTLVRQHWPMTVGIMMTGCNDVKLAASAINQHLIQFFVTKPWNNQTVLQVVDEAVKMHLKKIQDKQGTRDDGRYRANHEVSVNAVLSLARAVDARDNYTHRHSEKVARFAQIIGRAMNLDEQIVEELRIGGLLHDVGKIGIPDQILLKPSKLTEEEFHTIRLHPLIGASIVEPMELSSNITTIIRQHHENYDHSGYPLGLGKDDISMTASITHVVDAFEAMSANRVYRSARDPEWIEKEFLRCSGTQFRPQIVDVFLQKLKEGTI